MNKSPIPKIIWQTYKDDRKNLTDHIKRCIHSWEINNKEYEYRYYSDTDAAKLILDDYGQEWHDLFVNVPVGVVRGDIFRYLVIYKYGGVYTDLDTICKIPINNWITGPLKKQDSYNSVFASEMVGKDVLKVNRICQWTFASVPKSPILKNIIDNVYVALKSTDWNKITDLVTAIHYITGPDIFTYSVLNEMGFAIIKNNEYYIDPKVNFINNSKYVNDSEYAKENKILIYGDQNFGWFNTKAVKHLYGGSNEEWATNNKDYVQWKKQTIK